MRKKSTILNYIILYIYCLGVSRTGTSRVVLQRKSRGIRFSYVCFSLYNRYLCMYIVYCYTAHKNRILGHELIYINIVATLTFLADTFRRFNNFLSRNKIILYTAVCAYEWRERGFYLFPLSVLCKSEKRGGFLFGMRIL